MLVAFRPSFFNKMYLKLDTAETMHMSQSDLKESTRVLLDYIKGKRGDIDLEVTVANERVQMFNQREKAHMVDVKNLYNGVIKARNIMVIYVAFMALIALGLNDYASARNNRDNLRNALAIIGLFVGLIAFYALIDFNQFWTQFHLMFFDNDLWLLNPATDRMIQMFPGPFFNAMVLRIIVAFGVVLAVIVAILGLLEWKVRYDSRRSISS